MKKMTEFYENDLFDVLKKKGSSDTEDKKLEVFRFYMARFRISDMTQEKILRYIFEEITGKDEDEECDKILDYLIPFLTYQHLGPHRISQTFKNLPKSLSYTSEFVISQDITEDILYKYEKYIDFGILRNCEMISKKNFEKYHRDKFPDVKKYEDYQNNLKISSKFNF